MYNIMPEFWTSQVSTEFESLGCEFQIFNEI